MTTTTQTVSAPSLTARIEERILAPLRRNRFATRTWFLVSLAVVLLLHGSLLALLLFRDTGAPAQVESQETPIEVVIEPPKPKPPEVKKPEPPKPQAKPEIEKPASSAPRAPSEEKVDTASLAKETHAPKAPTPPKDGKPDASDEASSPSDDVAEPAKSEEKAAARPDVLKEDAEALAKAVPEPPKRPENLAKLTPRAKTRRPKTALERLAGASSLPDYSFARSTKKSPVSGGTEDSRYLAIVYGMIMAHRSRIDVPGDGGSVTIAFNVDGGGNLVGMDVENTSGYPEIDAAATAAIQRASPFPPPPAGAPHGLIATIDFGHAAPVYTMGSRGR